MTYVTITRDQLISFNPCDLDERLALFGTRKSMGVRAAIKAGASVSDILWIAGQLGLAAECAEFAQYCAERAKCATECATEYAEYAKYDKYANANAANAASEHAANAAAKCAAKCAAKYAANAANAASEHAANAAEINAQQADLIRLFGSR
jgi:predicted lipid-binding transport protein (Tim44 family)